MQFLSIFRKRRMWKTLNQENMHCSGGFLEEIKTLCVEKMHQIRTEIDKLQKKNQFFENFMHFLCTFRKTWWLRMLKTFSKEKFVVVAVFLKR